jgi:hypothetical protein
MKAYGGVDVDTHVFMTSALVGGEWSASRPGRFTPRGKSHGYPLDSWLDGSQNWSARRGDENNLASTPTRTPSPLPPSP